jgi:predicted O-methyltransferase YrrM
MSRDTLPITADLHDYILRVSLREADVLRRLREDTANHPMARMQLAPEQAQLLTLLVRAIGARRTLEVGVFTGYSSLAVALALPDDGRIVACDVSEDFTSMAARYWREAGVADKIDLRIAPAIETLDALVAAGEAGRFDFAFIDADKTGYVDYYERALTLLRPGGLIAADNVLRGGKVIDAPVNPANTATEADTEAIRRFNQHLLADDRVVISLVPIGDGMMLALKK